MTDEDSGAEDEGTVFHPENLSGNQLLAPAVFRVSRDDSFDDSEASNDEMDKDTRTEQQKIERRIVTKTSEQIKWKNEVRPQHTLTTLFPEANYSKYRDFTVVELFELFFDEEILMHTKEQMTKYCLKNNWPDINLSLTELKVFCAILLVSGYNTA